MESHVKWRRIDQILYREIYSRLHDTSKVFGTSTDMDGLSPIGDGKPFIMTEWGWSDADIPLIRYEKRGDEESFFLASISMIEE